MAAFTLQILDKDNKILCEDSGEDYAGIVYQQSYREGDKIRIETPQQNLYVIWQVDDGLGPAFCYLTRESVSYEIPLVKKRYPIRLKPSPETGITCT